ncbi:MAG TPA: glutathione transferase GstA, partial [Vineibacter sp.]|nr:glutathione transferase GstA [Vineibacter sp.]
DIKARTRRTQSGADYTTVTAKTYVPALELENGQVLTEGPAIVQFLADRASDTKLAPPATSFERYRLQEWLNFISTELHKTFTPLFHPDHGEQAATQARTKLAQRFAFLDQHLSNHDFLMGEQFTVADAYCFTIASWSALVRLDLSAFASLTAYLARIAARPKVREALQAEGLLHAAR